MINKFYEQGENSTILIIIGLFGGLIGGPIASLADYHAPPQTRLWLFIVPEFVGFACMGLWYIMENQEKGNQRRI